MIIPILIGVGVVSTGSWIVHHLLVAKKLDAIHEDVKKLQRRA